MKKINKKYIDTAKENLEKDGDLMPVVIINKEVIFGLRDFRPDNKYDVMYSLGEEVNRKKIDIDNIIFICESWMSIMSTKEFDKTKEYVQPSKDPNRREVIILSYQDVKKNKEIVMLPFERKNKKIIWEESIGLPNADESHFNILQPFWQGYFNVQSK